MNWREISDQKLVELCLQEGDQAEAWAEFLRRFQPLIAGVTSKTIRRWMPPNPSLVDDLVQTSLGKIFGNNCRAIRSFRWEHENAFRGFLKKVASNVVQDYFRKPPVRLETGLEEAGPDALSSRDLTHGVDMEIMIQQLISCLQKLLQAEADCKRSLAMFLLYYHHGLTAKQISGLYPLTIKAVENNLLRLVRLARGHCL